MLDIVNSNNWERPIYFTGGAFGNDDYIWMKDYLQLDGMVYKLVPIKTPVERANPFDMGRLDTEFMYNKVINWDWGNSGSNAIYHDPETRKNSITYRGNLARLIENLINEEQLEKAEEIAELFKDVSKKYQETLTYYGNLTLDNKKENFTEILTDIERYKALVDVLTNYDREFAEKESMEFNNYLRLFKEFYDDYDEEDTPREDKDLPQDSATPINN